MGKRFKRSAETVRARATQTGGDYDSYIASDVKQFKPKEGENTIRIMPPTWDVKKWGDNWGIEIWVHNNIGADNAQYLCLNKMKGEDCPLCNARAELEGDEASALKPKKRILAWVLDRDQEKTGPMVWNLGWQMEKDIQVRCLDKSGEVVQIDDTEEGYDIDFTREGTKLNTKYLGVQIARKPSPLCQDEDRQEKFLDFTDENPLTDLLVYHDAEYIEKVYMGQSRKKDEDSGEKSSRGGGRNRRDQEEERGSGKEESRSRRGRDEEDKTEERSSRRSRDADKDDDRPRRGSRDEADDDKKEDDRPRRGRRDEPDDDDKKEETPRRGRRSAEEEPEDAIPSEGRSRRSRDKDDDKTEGDDDVKTARDKVSRLKEEQTERRGGGQRRR